MNRNDCHLGGQIFTAAYVPCSVWCKGGSWSANCWRAGPSPEDDLPDKIFAMVFGGGGLKFLNTEAKKFFLV